MCFLSSSPILMPRQHFETAARDRRASLRNKSSDLIDWMDVDSIIPSKRCDPPSMDWRTFCGVSEIYHPREARILLCTYAFMHEAKGFARFLAASKQMAVQYLWVLEEEKKHAVRIVR